jgi:hypothetical protein
LAFSGTEGQTYLIFQHPAHESGHGEEADDENMSESTRPAFFRFGGWCYGGNVVVEHGVGEMSLSSLVGVLPSLGEQQRSMSFSTELERLPETSRQYLALRRLQQASEYLLEQLESAESELDKLKKFLEKRGQQAWVDDESRNVYFELQLSTEGADPLACVEVSWVCFQTNNAFGFLIFLLLLLLFRSPRPRSTSTACSCRPCTLVGRSTPLSPADHQERTHYSTLLFLTLHQREEVRRK